MTFAQDFPGVSEAGDQAGRAWRLPLGAVSPLWALFGAAAGAGIAYWWATRFAGRAAAAPTGDRRIAAPAQTVSPASQADAEMAPSPAPLSVVADDLTRMVGIGPKLSEALARRGVTRFAQVAAWTADDLAEVDAALGLKGRAVREAWVAQAKRLAAEG